MKEKHLSQQHSLVLVLVGLFFIIATVDFLNFDSILYRLLCIPMAPYFNLSCTDYYDMPIWDVYLSVAILATLYHVHDEVRSTNTHLASRK